MPARKKARKSSNVDAKYNDTHQQQHQHHQHKKQSNDQHNPNEPFCLFEAETEIIETWFNDLDDADKVGCLQIEQDELLEVVASLGLLASEDGTSLREGAVITPQLIESFLSNADVISALRLAFVNALYNDGMFDPLAVRAAARSEGMLDVYSELLIQCALSVLESHLIEVQRRKRAVVRMLAFTCFFIFRVAAFTRWLRWPLGFVSFLALHVATTQTGATKDETEMSTDSEEYLALHTQYKALIRRYQSHLQLLLVPFEPASPAVRYIAFDRCSSPINAKIDALACSICTATWVAEQFTMNLMTWIFLVVLATLPFILTTIQQYGRRQVEATLNQQILHYLQLIVAALSQLIVVFYAFKTSYVDCLFALVFFLPSVLSFVMSGLGLGLATAATCFIAMQSYIFDYTKRPIIYCLVWCGLLCHHVFSDITSSVVWTCSWIFMFLLTPPQVAGGLCVLSTVCTTALLSVGLTQLLALVFEVGLLSCFSVAVVVFHFGRLYTLKLAMPLIKRYVTRGKFGNLLRSILGCLRKARTVLVEIKRARTEA